MAVMIDKETKEAVPVTQFLNGDRLANDVARVNDAARGKFLSIVGMALARDAQLRSVPVADALQDDRPAARSSTRPSAPRAATTARSDGDRTLADIEKRRSDRWNFLFIAGMWFQDLFNYDFRRTEQCIIPYATQEGEISFCAYNTGVGWRNIVEKMHMTATLTKWYEEQRPSRDLRRRQVRKAQYAPSTTWCCATSWSPTKPRRIWTLSASRRPRARKRCALATSRQKKAQANRGRPHDGRFTRSTS